MVKYYILPKIVIMFCLMGLAHAETYTGKTQWAETIELSSYLSTTVAKVLVREGDRVKAGDNLLLMDNTIQQLNLEIAQSKQDALATIKEQAEMDYNRALELYDRTILSDVALKNEEFKLAKAIGDFESALAAKKKAEFLFNSSNIVSPIDGRIVKISASVGEFSNNEHARSLVTVANDSEMHAVSYIKVSQWNQSLVGKKATVVINQKSYKGMVKSLGLVPVKNTKGLSVFPMIVSFKTKNTIPSGMPLTIDIK